MAEPDHEPLVMYGEPSETRPLEWSWVDGQLAAAGTYWVVPVGGDHPHPRPVWGVWHDRKLQLSVGSPVLARQLVAGSPVTVHLDSGVDVVILEGSVHGHTDDGEVLSQYNEKYDWNYAVEEYGPLTTVAPATILAWRSAGWAGREGFQQTGRWRLERTTLLP